MYLRLVRKRIKDWNQSTKEGKEESTFLLSFLLFVSFKAMIRRYLSELTSAWPPNLKFLNFFYFISFLSDSHVNYQSVSSLLLLFASYFVYLFCVCKNDFSLSFSITIIIRGYIASVQPLGTSNRIQIIGHSLDEKPSIARSFLCEIIKFSLFSPV